MFSVFLFKVGSTTWHQHFVSLANPGMHAELEKHERDEQESILIKFTSKHGTYVSIPAGQDDDAKRIRPCHFGPDHCLLLNGAPSLREDRLCLRGQGDPQVQGGFFNCSAQIPVLKKTLFNQRGSFVHREFHGAESLIGCPSFFILVLKIGRDS